MLSLQNAMSEDEVREFDGREYACAFARDISSRHEAELKLRLSEERYRSLVSATAQMVWTTDANGSEFRQIPNLAGNNVAWPVWSADGKYLAYTLFGLNTFLIEPGKPWSARTTPS